MYARLKNVLHRWCKSRTCTYVLALTASILLLAYFVTGSLKRTTTIDDSKSIDEMFETILEYPESIPYPQENKIMQSFPLVREYQSNSKTEHARRIGFSLLGYQSVTDNFSTSRVIYLATNYFTQTYPDTFYFPLLGKETFERYSCPVKNCYVTRDPSQLSTAHAVLFHARDMSIFSIPYQRSPQQIYILYSMEPPGLEMTDFRRFNGLINWTMSYRRNSDIRMSYGFIGRRPKVKRKQYSRLGVLKKKMNKALWYVSNCNTDSNREEYVRRLKKIYPVDIYGSCSTKGCLPAESKKCYTFAEREYKFYLSFENSLCQDYVTEKLFNPLEYFIIPVTFSGPNLTNILPAHSVINALEFPSPEDLGSYLWKVSFNESLYLSYFEWKRYYRSYLQPWMCDLCAKLHEPLIPKISNDLDNWWHENGTCLRWTNGTFKRIETYAFPSYAKWDT